jgi:hypothetical protein
LQNIQNTPEEDTPLLPLELMEGANASVQQLLDRMLEEWESLTDNDAV